MIINEEVNVISGVLDFYSSCSYDDFRRKELDMGEYEFMLWKEFNEGKSDYWLMLS